MSSDAEIVSDLQELSFNSCLEIVPKIKRGQSEIEIADLIKSALFKRGIEQYWYDIPIIVLVGKERFLSSVNDHNDKKSPSPNIFLKDRDTVYIDIHPQDTKTEIWGDWNTMFVFQPNNKKDKNQIDFLNLVRQILFDGIQSLKSSMRFCDIYDLFLNKYRENNISTLWGDNSNIGHTLHKGDKLSAKRLFISPDNKQIIGGEIFSLEPGGYQYTGDELLVGRFEECVFVSKENKSTHLGNNSLFPLYL